MSFTIPISQALRSTAFVAVLVCMTSCGKALACHACGSASCGVSWKMVEVEQEYVVRVPYTKQVERTVTVNVPHFEQVEQTYTAMVPHTEVRTGTKTILKAIPEVKTVTVSRDFGRWLTPVQPSISACECQSACCACDCLTCGNCCACQSPCAEQASCAPVWEPDVRTKEISTTTYRKVTEEVPYEYKVTVHRPEERKRMVNVVRYKTEERKQTTKVIDYQEETRIRKVCVPQPTCECCVHAVQCCH